MLINDADESNADLARDRPRHRAIQESGSQRTVTAFAYRRRLTNLAKVADLKVISRTSVAQYKKPATRNVREIGKLLGVAHVLEGSVQKVANKVRVNAQLIDARNDAHLWAQTYDRDLADVFAIQTEIAEAIARQLQVRLSPDEKAEMAKPTTNDPVAYDLYLRARQLDDLSNDPDAKSRLLQGISLLEEVVPSA